MYTTPYPMNGMEYQVEARQRKTQAINEWKGKLALAYSTYLLPPTALPSAEIDFAVIKVHDTAEERVAKTKHNEELMRQRDAEYLERKDQLVFELEKLADKVRATLRERGDVTQVYGLGTVVHQMDDITCPVCKNKNPDFFIHDPVSGYKTCLGKDGAGCGEVVARNNIHEGSGVRNFEDKEDRTHFGPAPNRLMPDHVNLEVSFIPLNPNDKKIARTLQNVDMDLSKIEKEERHTREGYKTAKKREAFSLLEDVGLKMNVHQQFIQRAKEIFAIHRDAKDTVHKFEGTVIACIVAAFEEAPDELAFEKRERRFIRSTIGSSVEETPVTRASVVHDAAICTVPDLPINKFSIANVQQWLRAVAVTATGREREMAMFVDPIVAFIREQLEKETSAQGSVSAAAVPSSSTASASAPGAKRQRLDPTKGGSMFKATIASRKPVSAVVREKEEVFAGKFLLNKAILERALQIPSTSDKEREKEKRAEVEAVKFFSSAVARRYQFDKLLVEKEKARVAEQQRLHKASSSTLLLKEKEIDEFKRKTLAASAPPPSSSSSSSSSQPSTVTSDAVSTSTTTTVTTTAAIAKEPDLEVEEDFDFADLAGGAVKQISKRILGETPEPEKKEPETQQQQQPLQAPVTGEPAVRTITLKPAGSKKKLNITFA